MAVVPPIIYQEYTRFQTLFDASLLGIIEIGSFAHKEAIQVSDHDLRLIIRSDDPLFVFDEYAWTEPIADTIMDVRWSDLNQHSEISFGLTNLAYIERMLPTGRYPLLDHSCLYQGCILTDGTGAITAFRDQHHDKYFANIVPDYLQQLAWRVTSKLPHELSTLTQHLDHQKYAVPPLHTCYRVLRDMANIASYRATNVYLNDTDAVAAYYYRHWPWFYPIFERLRSYKTNETVRQAVFQETAHHVPERLREIEVWTEAIVSLWQQFHRQYQ